MNRRWQALTTVAVLATVLSIAPAERSAAQQFSCSVVADVGFWVSVSWDDIGAVGYDVIEDGGAKRWVTGTSTLDFTPGTEYEVVAFGNGTDWTTATCVNPDVEPPPDPGTTVSLLATGDIAVCGDFHPPVVGAYVEGRTDASFMPLGDIAYPNGSITDFADCFDPFFVDAKERTLPVVGNHEYYTAEAAGYVDYYGAAAGAPDRLFYSSDLGAWHVIVLNSECGRIGGCDVDSVQYQWLVDDLAANDRPCILVGWHHAFFTSEVVGKDATFMRDMYALLDGAGADVLLTGHSHGYERFEPMDADGLPSTDGIRSFVIGTGGAAQRPFAFVHDGSEVRQSHTWGVLDLTLGDGDYSWEFVRTSGDAFTDTGSGSC